MLRRASRASPGLLGSIREPREGPSGRLDESKSIPCCCSFMRSALDFHGNCVLWVIGFLATVIHGT
jgi:hypothetical protein